MISKSGSDFHSDNLEPVRSEFYRRMTALPASGRDAELAQEWTIAQFLRALAALEEPHAPMQLLTAEEVRSLGFVRHRFQRGELAP